MTDAAKKTEAENVVLRSMLGGATEDIFNKYVEDIQAYEDRALAAEAEIVALRKRLDVDDAMVERARVARSLFRVNYTDSRLPPEIIDHESMRAALEAALGSDAMGEDVRVRDKALDEALAIISRWIEEEPRSEYAQLVWRESVQSRTARDIYAAIRALKAAKE